MGGGDLNLKKSWHPNTMKNMERVWKAEQKDSEEKKRIAELQREIVAERSKEDLQRHGEESGVLKKKDEVKLEWMYKKPSQTVNNEEYLLGKAIDKNFEKIQHESKDLPSTSASGMSSFSGIPDVQVDMARKVVEDPLEVIRRRAIEKAKELYNNPVKLKKIQKMLALQAERKKKSKKEKKHKKKHKKKSKSLQKTESDCSDEDLDALLTAKLKKVLRNKDILRKVKETTDSSRSSDSDCSSESNASKKAASFKSSDNSGEHSQHFQKNVSQYPSSSGRTRSRSREMDKKHHEHSHTPRKLGPENPQKYKGNLNYLKSQGSLGKTSHQSSKHERKSRPLNQSSEGGKERKRRHLSSSSESESEYQRPLSDDDHSSKYKKGFGLMMPDGSKPVVHRQSQMVEHKSQPEVKKPTWERKERVRLTEEEKEKRRQEMVANAGWRDRERAAAVQRHKQEEDRERNQLERNFDENFAMKQFSKATEAASIEGRIKSKLNNIQRSNISMDKNFARR